MSRTGLFIPLALTLAACSATPRPQAPSWDTPVPASEPRAELKLALDLPPVSDCDERFALALYENRGVELLSWDETGLATPHCSERRLTIRYLSRRLTRDALLQRVREISRKASVVER
jgi:hypothetical protein